MTTRHLGLHFHSQLAAQYCREAPISGVAPPKCYAESIRAHEGAPVPKLIDNRLTHVSQKTSLPSEHPLQTQYASPGLLTRNLIAFLRCTRALKFLRDSDCHAGTKTPAARR